MANRYCDVAFADNYVNEYKIDANRWNGYESTKKEIFLNIATQAIDRLRIRGEKTVATQTLKFPRTPDTEIPLDVKKACTEIAFAMSEGKDPELEQERLFTSQKKFGQLGSSTSFFKEHILHGIVSAEAWNFLKKYLQPNDTLNLTRI